MWVWTWPSGAWAISSARTWGVVTTAPGLEANCAAAGMLAAELDASLTQRPCSLSDVARVEHDECRRRARRATIHRCRSLLELEIDRSGSEDGTTIIATNQTEAEAIDVKLDRRLEALDAQVNALHDR